jgi:ferredoxin
LKTRLPSAIPYDRGAPRVEPRRYAMALKITELCVNCDVCEPVCPNKAISMGPEIYEIAPNLCTECVGHHDEPQCIVVCPVECIFVDETLAESREQLLDKYAVLTGKEPAP